ncbi:hypothetical protein Droror1_Dr00027162, partial [Drosera rotundifolia]
HQQPPPPHRLFSLIPDFCRLSPRFPYLHRRLLSLTAHQATAFTAIRRTPLPLLSGSLASSQR